MLDLVNYVRKCAKTRKGVWLKLFKNEQLKSCSRLSVKIQTHKSMDASLHSFSSNKTCRCFIALIPTVTLHLFLWCTFFVKAKQNRTDM